MDFHFIKLNYNGTYLSLVDPNSKSRFVCFAEKGIAMKCVDYSAEFRARNRIWPCLDMTSENKKLELIGSKLSLWITTNYKTFIRNRNI